MTETITCPPDHPHNSTCYGTHRCRCQRCHDAKNATQRAYRKNLAYGRPPTTSAAPVRAHVRKLQRFGIGIPRIAELSGVGKRSVSTLMYGRRDKRGKLVKPKRVTVATANAILAVEPVRENLSSRVGALSARGAQRRIQALAAVGWSLSKIGVHLGVSPERVRDILAAEKISRGLHERVCATFDEIWDQTPPIDTVPERIAYIRTVNMAASRGWVPPAAWDDIDTDHRAATRYRFDPTIDEIAVELSVEGHRPNLNTAEREEVVRILNGRKWSDPAIAAHTGLEERTVFRIRHDRLNLPGWDKHEQARNLERSAA